MPRERRFCQSVKVGARSGAGTNGGVLLNPNSQSEGSLLPLLLTFRRPSGRYPRASFADTSHFWPAFLARKLPVLIRWLTFDS